MLIPISLYVSIEIVKLGQIYFIHNDLALYNEQLDSRIQCRALNITEDLGQIQYLFSDKTGTLTENKMVFRRCSIYGVEYPHKENGKDQYHDFGFHRSTDPAVTLRLLIQTNTDNVVGRLKRKGCIGVLTIAM